MGMCSSTDAWGEERAFPRGEVVEWSQEASSKNQHISTFPVLLVIECISRRHAHAKIQQG